MFAVHSLPLMKADPVLTPLYPADLTTMELKLESNLYPTMTEFLYDANLIFQNCRQYNPENSTYVKNANKLERYMKERGASFWPHALASRARLIIAYAVS